MGIIEFSAAILTLACVWLLSVKKTLDWPIGIISAGLFFIVFLKQELFFQTGLQIVYVAQSAYGWWIWKKDAKELKLSEISNWQLLTDTLLATALTLSIMLYMNMSLNLFLDALTTLLALLATYYLSKKIVQAWYLWVLVNVLLIVLCVLNSLWWTLGLEIILLGIAVKTSFEWEISLTHQNYEDGKEV